MVFESLVFNFFSNFLFFFLFLDKPSSNILKKLFVAQQITKQKQRQQQRQQQKQ